MLAQVYIAARCKRLADAARGTSQSLGCLGIKAMLRGFLQNPFPVCFLEYLRYRAGGVARSTRLLYSGLENV
jgi:hypothetical protein